MGSELCVRLVVFSSNPSVQRLSYASVLMEHDPDGIVCGPAGQGPAEADRDAITCGPEVLQGPAAERRKRRQPPLGRATALRASGGFIVWLLGGGDTVSAIGEVASRQEHVLVDRWVFAVALARWKYCPAHECDEEQQASLINVTGAWGVIDYSFTQVFQLRDPMPWQTEIADVNDPLTSSLIFNDLQDRVTLGSDQTVRQLLHPHAELRMVAMDVSLCHVSRQALATPLPACFRRVLLGRRIPWHEIVPSCPKKKEVMCWRRHDMVKEDAQVARRPLLPRRMLRPR